MTTAEEIAGELGFLQPDDVKHVISTLVDLHDDQVPPEIAEEVREILNPHYERTLPARAYWPGHPEELPDPNAGVTFPSPTRPEGFYPPI